ncbi:MAG: thioredoxin domain-containing protein [Thermodesulfobacteriota bacterium]
MPDRNRLKNEKSPYLLQHADNPVDWYPWGEEAFERAAREDKPILLSIGYSTCHWCHVMEHESFEDPEVARLMNETFVSIKVDREERPDIDNIYMTVCQLLSKGGCGWPLNIIMTPDKKPFFAGTYIPKETRFGRIGMVELVPRIKEVWKNQRDEVLKSADSITAAVKKATDITREPGGRDLSQATMTLGYNQLLGRFDETNGGFGTAPKFPTPHNLLFLLRYWKRTGDEQALRMVEATLGGMRKGGVYDHVGFGFHRYSTDPRWFLPHFEKMLYDQAALALVFTEAYQATGKKEYEDTARKIFTYVLRDMTSPEGGFYSAEDADSEGEEGKFYVWTQDEIIEVLGKDDAELFIKTYNIEKTGNFREEASGEKTGSNILYLKMSLPELARSYGMSAEEFGDRIEKSREKLFDVRERRVHPHKDDKVLTDWNGLMIAALSRGAGVFDDTLYSDSAKRAADFVLDKLRDSKGRLLHRWRDGEAGISGSIDDYSFFIWGLLELYESTFDIEYLKAALALQNEMNELFWDNKNGGFYFTSHDAEELISRQKEVYDGAIPSGNSVAMLNLLRIGRITGDSSYDEMAAKLAKAFSQSVEQAPMAYTQLLSSLDFAIGPSYEVVVAGDPASPDTKDMLSALRKKYVPNKVMLFKGNEDSDGIAAIAEFTKGQSAIDGKATAYVCIDQVCNLPTTDLNKALELLSK